MPSIPTGPLDREERQQVAAYLGERLVGSVGLDVWTREESSLLVRTDRDTCTHCPDLLALMRQISTVHPMLSITPYDLTKHASRAAEAGIDYVPTTVIRGGGRSLQMVGFFSGLLFPVMLDLIAFASNTWSPVLDATREALQALTTPVELEVMVAPYDGASAHLARVTGAFGVESRNVHVRIIEMAEFPVLAGQRSLTEVPALTINGRRFVGAWDEDDLVLQIQRVLAGDDTPVIRDRVLAGRYVTEAEAHELAHQQAANEAEAQALAPGTPPAGGAPSSGLYIPGRD